MDKDQVRLAVELRLVASNIYGTPHLDLGFGTYDENTGEFAHPPYGDETEKLYEFGITSHVWDYQPPQIVWGDCIEMHKHKPSMRDLKRLMPTMKRLDKAIDDYRTESGDYSYAGAIAALAKATKAKRLVYREGFSTRHIKRGDIYAEVVRIIDAYVAKHGKVAA